jgi:hypothetical protein
MSSIRIQLALDNWDDYVFRLTSMSDRELEKKLELVYLQSEIAERAKNSDSLELLDIWRRQIIEARTLKAENNIPDAPNDIELAIADIETTIAKAEERKDIFNGTENPVTPSRPKMEEKDDNQMSLF